MSAAMHVPLEGELRHNEPMARHTSWRVGGPVDTYFRPANRAALIEFIKDLEPGTPVTWVGLGSNLLVRDGGLRGVVIATARALGGLEREGEHGVVAGAGVPCTALARRCARWGLGPAEFFAGIPGTVGGALTMNAGAFEGETWDSVTRVETVDRAGQVHTRTPADYRIAYRQVEGPEDEWFLSARFAFDDAGEAALSRVRELMRQREESQPLGEPSCGSVFRNPPGDYAARLIEVAGLKGYAIGGARVSTKHANFIINEGDASASDVEQLIEHVRTTVKNEHGIELQTEVHVVGEAAGGAA